MSTRSRLLPVLACALALSAAVAQRPTLNLEFGGDVYISHVSAGLEALPSYRQLAVSVVTSTGADGEESVNRNEEGRAYAAASGYAAGFAHYGIGRAMPMYSAQFVVDGAGFMAGGSAPADAQCFPTPAETAMPSPLETGVADLTGFKSATLAQAGETVNGVLSDRYVLDDPPYAGRFEGGELQGTLWLAREGGFVVRYEITGVDAGGTRLEWYYDLTDVGAVSAPELPEACAGL